MMTNFERLINMDDNNYKKRIDIIYDVLEDNPVGGYHRTEEIYDDVLSLSLNDAEKYCKNNNIPFKRMPAKEYIKFRRYTRPYEIIYLEKYLDYDRKEMVKVLNDAEFDPDDLLDRVTKAQEKIDEFRENKEFIDNLSDALYDKCVFSLLAYELVRGMKVKILPDRDRE